MVTWHEEFATSIMSQLALYVEYLDFGCILEPQPN